MKRGFQLAILTITFLTIYTACNTRSGDPGKKKSSENMYSTDAEDQQMNEAIATARRTFGNFDKAFKSSNHDDNNFSIKVRFAHPNGYEHIWATDIWVKDGRYWGIISDTPAITTKVRLGDSVAIDRADITDWMYGNDSVLHGGYTIRVILSRMSKEEKAKVEADLPQRIED